MSEHPSSRNDDVRRWRLYKVSDGDSGGNYWYETHADGPELTRDEEVEVMPVKIRPDRSDDRVVDLKGCARCQGDGHEGLRFKQLTHPFEPDDGGPFTHWAPCPINGEPILMRITVAPDV